MKKLTLLGTVVMTFYLTYLLVFTGCRTKTGYPTDQIHTVIAQVIPGSTIIPFHDSSGYYYKVRIKYTDLTDSTVQVADTLVYIDVDNTPSPLLVKVHLAANQPVDTFNLGVVFLVEHTDKTVMLQ